MIMKIYFMASTILNFGGVKKVLFVIESFLIKENEVLILCIYDRFLIDRSI